VSVLANRSFVCIHAIEGHHPGFPPSKTDVHSAGLDAFRQGLRDLGYVEGQTIVIEYR
jgi:hypothetical protein